jgi:hypothetical protein
VGFWSEASGEAQAVYHLRLGGLSFPEIAERLEISVDQAIVFYRDRVTRAAKVFGGDERRVVTETELARLDALQEPFWLSATSGDRDDAKFVLQIIQTRMKMLSLDTPDKNVAEVARVLVVGGTQKEFMEALSEGRYMTGLSSETGSDSKEAS